MYIYIYIERERDTFFSVHFSTSTTQPTPGGFEVASSLLAILFVCVCLRLFSPPPVIMNPLSNKKQTTLGDWFVCYPVSTRLDFPPHTKNNNEKASLLVKPPNKTKTILWATTQILPSIQTEAQSPGGFVDHKSIDV